MVGGLHREGTLKVWKRPWIHRKVLLNLFTLVNRSHGVQKVRQKRRKLFLDGLERVVKNVGAFCPCPKSLPEAKIKILTALIRSQKKSSIDFVLQITLAKNIFIRQSKLRKEKYKMYGSENRGALGSGMKLNPMFKDIKWN